MVLMAQFYDVGDPQDHCGGLVGTGLAMPGAVLYPLSILLSMQGAVTPVLAGPPRASSLALRAAAGRRSGGWAGTNPVRVDHGKENL